MGMIVAGIVLIEPALVRLILHVFFSGEFQPAAYLSTIGLVYALLITLIIRDRNSKKGRWVFPMALLLFLMVHSMIIFQIRLAAWESFVDWFAALPLT